MHKVHLRSLKVETLGFLLSLAALFIPLRCGAQSIENRYRSHLGNGGITYFFCPKHVGHGANICRFVYDMTYKMGSDSVILNFSILTIRPMKVKKFVLQCGEEHLCEGKAVSTLYADLIGKKYEIRTTSKFSMNDIYKMFSQSEELNFNMLFDNGEKGSAKYGKSKWKRESQQITRIIDLINYEK